mmetsp:Transcript_119112/g.336942  ORF Transcript_119112/g.336942 Transcript_119112/m.336942 type:complete len:286 (-) Transcript_119112:77-934(-)
MQKRANPGGGVNRHHRILQRQQHCHGRPVRQHTADGAGALEEKNLAIAARGDQAVPRSPRCRHDGSGRALGTKGSTSTFEDGGQTVGLPEFQVRRAERHKQGWNVWPVWRRQDAMDTAVLVRGTDSERPSFFPAIMEPAIPSRGPHRERVIPVRADTDHHLAALRKPDRLDVGLMERHRREALPCVWAPKHDFGVTGAGPAQLPRRPDILLWRISQTRQRGAMAVHEPLLAAVEVEHNNQLACSYGGPPGRQKDNSCSSVRVKAMDVFERRGLHGALCGLGALPA